MSLTSHLAEVSASSGFFSDTIAEADPEIAAAQLEGSKSFAKELMARLRGGCIGKGHVKRLEL